MDNKLSFWYEKLPRDSWNKFPKLEVKNDWFEVYKLPHDVYAIYEPGQFEEVISYLILGEDKTILWDTGLGIGNIKSLVLELTSLPVVVVNSHTHYDHIGGNILFDEICVLDNEYAINELNRGLSHEEIKFLIEDNAVWKEFPREFDPENFTIKGKSPTRLLKDGEIIDLGNRQLEVVHAPGHSPDAIILIDEKNKLLFTGDVYYPAPLYAFAQGANLLTYIGSMRKIVNKIKDKDIEWIYPSHNEIVEGSNVLVSILDNMEEIAKGAKRDYSYNKDGLRVYEFLDGIKIITLDEDYYRE